MVPRTVDDAIRLAAEHMAAGRAGEAEQIFRQILQVDPNEGTALFHLGGMLKDAGRIDESIELLSRLSLTHAQWPVGLVRYGFVLLEVRKVAEAEVVFRRAIAVQPDFADAHYGLAWTLLVRGELDQGWAEYEWRLKCGELSANVRHRYPQPRWDGSNLSGRTILLHQEQGLGDVIQFSRFIPEVVRRGGRVIVGCAPELAGLIGRIPGVISVATNSNQLPPFDTHISLHSLPWVLRINLDNLPAQVPYLHPNATQVDRWRQRVDRSDGAMHIGLSWAGSPAQANDRNRSIALVELSVFRDAGNLRFYSLQKGPAAQQVSASPLKIIDWAPELNDLDTAAAAMAALDLIITVDTSIAHLAGAIGRPVFTLLPFFHCWRWMLDRRDSPWYPTMRLFRQPKRGDWSSILQRMVEEIKSLRANQ